MCTTEEHIELPPCPFCGSESPQIMESMAGGFNISCNGPISCVCFLLNESCSTREEVAKRWNRRDGDKCRHGCKIKRAIKTFVNSLDESETSECDG